MENITFSRLSEMEARFDASSAAHVAMNAVVNLGINEVAKDYAVERNIPYQFSISLDQGEITNQKRSGRCWMFAALNTMRSHIIKTLNIDTFELSQAYTLFYDKLEKANYFLESILKTLDEPTDGRLIAHLLTAPLGDGGQWDMLCNLVEKYGLVPKDAYKESVSSSATAQMNAYMTEKLREDACILRTEYQNGASKEKLLAEKEQMLDTIYHILCVCLGKPPKTFTFEYRDKDNVFHRDENLTPKEFYHKYIGMDLSEYISLINAPTADKPYYRSYTVQFLGNVVEGRIVKYVNLPSEELKKAAIAQLSDGEPVWFGCDVGKRSHRDSGIMDPDIYDLPSVLGTSFGMTKAQRLDYGQSVMTHAMVFQGVNLDKDGKPNRWKVENSWGEEPGKKGYYVMSDKWFDEYNYQIVVRRKYLSPEILAAYDSDPIELKPWDPCGSLAF